MTEILAANSDVAHIQTLRKLQSWKRFHFGPRAENVELLQGLSHHSDPGPVAGCQRSASTMFTRVIANSKGFLRLALTHGDELAAALALSGKLICRREIDIAGSTYLKCMGYVSDLKE